MFYLNQSSPKDSVFHSMFNMVMTNGSASHIHTIGNATANSITKEGNNTLIEGNVSITMKDGPISNIPTISPLQTITLLLYCQTPQK